MPYVVSLKQFDGPLDLLLTLISRAKIAIEDIFVSEITEQYLASMRGVSELDMDAASEFLQMAAMLLEIKSRSLLPTPPREDAELEETPEEALIRQLNEYKRFKELSGDMRTLEAEARELITKLPEEYPLPPPSYELTGMTLEGLARAFARVLARSRERSDETEMEKREIRRDYFSVKSCMLRIQTRLRDGEKSFSDMFDESPEREEVISVFLALLELLRLGRVRVTQKKTYAEMYLRWEL